MEPISNTRLFMGAIPTSWHSVVEVLVFFTSDAALRRAGVLNLGRDLGLLSGLLSSAVE